MEIYNAIIAYLIVKDIIYCVTIMLIIKAENSKRIKDQ